MFEYDRLYFTHRAYQKGKDMNIMKQWSKFLTQTIEYMADDTIYIKNQRILFALVTNCLSQLHEENFKLLKNDLEIVLDTCYNLKTDKQDKIDIPASIFDFFNK